MRRLMKKCEASISIFMAIIMLGTFVMSGIIVEGARLRQAEAIVQSAADSAAMSVLAKYDKGLYDRYGLFAIENDGGTTNVEQAIKDDFMRFFRANLSASLPDEGALDSLFTQLEQRYGLKKSGVDQLFDMYDFKVEDSEVNPIYSVAAPQIMQLQMTEVAKYRSAFMLIHDLTGMGDDIAEEAEQQQKDVKVMQDSLAYRNSAQSAAGKLAEHSKNLYMFYVDETIGNVKGTEKRADRLVNEYNTGVNDINTKFDTFKRDYDTMQTALSNLKTALTDYNSKAAEVRTAEEAVQNKKDDIIFDDTNEDYDEEAVKEWETECATVDAMVGELDGLEINVGKKVSDYKTAQTNLTGPSGSYTAFKKSIKDLKDKLEAWNSRIDELIEEYNGLKGEVESVKQQIENHKTYVNGSGASDGTKEAAIEDADSVLKSLEDALAPPTSAEQLEKTKAYISERLAEIETFSDITVNVPDIPYNNYSLYLDKTGTIPVIKDAFTTAHSSTTASSGTTVKTAPDRPEWKNLSDMIEFDESAAVTISPANIINDTKGIISALQKPNGKAPLPAGVVEHYVYELVEDSDVAAQSSQLSNSESGVSKLKALYDNAYDKDGNRKDGTKNNTDKSGDEGLSSFNVSSVTNLPSKNRETIKNTLNDSHKSADEGYKQRVVDRYGSGSPRVESSATGLSNEDDKQLDEFSGVDFGTDSSSQSAALGTMNNFMSKIQNFFVHSQYDVMTYCYINSMFKSRMTKDPADWAKVFDAANINEDDRKKDNPWFVARDTEDSDLNLMLDHMASDDEDMVTALNCELEYIIRGKDTDKKNRDQVWGIIYGIRLGNNLIAVYQNKEIRNAAKAVGNLVKMIPYVGAVLAPIVEFAIIALVAALETYQDMVFLVNQGYKVPFIKTKDNLTYSLENLSDGVLDKPSFKDEDGDGKPDGITGKLWISYENYLLIFMLFAGQENVLFRSADLIQMNMSKETGKQYDLAKCYSYVRCKNDVSIKPLMISYAFMPDDMRKNDRRTFETLVYQGY